MDADERQIREVHSTWIDAVNAGDLARLLTLVADDVVFLNPGQAPFGRDGFSAHFSAAQRQARIRCVSELEEDIGVEAEPFSAHGAHPVRGLDPQDDSAG